MGRLGWLNVRTRGEFPARIPDRPACGSPRAPPGPAPHAGCGIAKIEWQVRERDERTSSSRSSELSSIPISLCASALRVVASSIFSVISVAVWRARRAGGVSQGLGRAAHSAGGGGGGGGDCGDGDG
eukprot:scaffold38414_cov60-Phaeocystis_antarctica.AAC.2